MVKERNVAVCIILSLITCGIYTLYWYCTVTDDVDTISNNPEKRNGVLVILLSLITCGIYGIYWWYKNGEFMEQANNSKNISGSSNPVLYLILSLFGLSIINFVIVQIDINKHAKLN